MAQLATNEVMMVIAGLLLLSLGLLDTKPSPVLADVYIGGEGPYRFLVDTGAQTSLIDPSLAAQLRLQPEFRVELVTQHSTQLAPGRKVTTLRVGQRSLPEIELLFHDVGEARRLDASVQGVLGLNALSSFNFTLSPATGRFDSMAERPTEEVVPFSRLEGRMAIQARMGRQSLTLVLDSGSNHVVLFRLPAAMSKTPAVPATISTIEGARSVVPTRWTAEMFLTNHLRSGTLPAALVEAKGTQAEGLLPASVFKQVYVDQGRRELVLVR